MCWEGIIFEKKKFDALCRILFWFFANYLNLEKNHIWEKFPVEINCSLHLQLPFNETVKGSIVADKFQGIRNL